MGPNVVLNALASTRIGPPGLIGTGGEGGYYTSTNHPYTSTKIGWCDERRRGKVQRQTILLSFLNINIKWPNFLLQTILWFLILRNNDISSRHIITFLMRSNS